jgi:spermidine/putrescine transport system permease protein
VSHDVSLSQDRPGRQSLLSRWQHLFRRSEQVRGYSLLSPTLVVMVLFLAVPLGILFTLSFWEQDYIDIIATFTVKNYAKFFEREIYALLLGRSIVMALCVATATILLAYPMAYCLAFRIKRAKIMWLILITVPFWTSFLLRVFAWKITLGYQGVINQGLIKLGFIEEPLQFLLYNPIAVVITLTHAWAAFAILPIYVSLEKIDRSLLEAATDLGDGPFSRFLGVTLPLSLPGVIAAFLFVFIPTVGDYVTPTLVGGIDGIMIGNIIQTMFGRGNNWPFGAALAIISMLSITILICTALWFIKKMRSR